VLLARSVALWPLYYVAGGAGKLPFPLGLFQLFPHVFAGAFVTRYYGGYIKTSVYAIIFLASFYVRNVLKIKQIAYTPGLLSSITNCCRHAPTPAFSA